MYDLTAPTYDTIQGPDGDAVVICDAVLTLNGRVVMCSGLGPTDTIAKAKMISEAAERIIYLASRDEKGAPASSTGFAAHVTPQAAEVAARHELIERSFLDQLRRKPHLVSPQKSNGRTWSYRVPEHDCWVSIARVETQTTSGWGAGVATEVQSAEQAALMESFMMSSSHAAYGRRGNAVTVLSGGAERLGQRIQVRHFPKMHLHDEPRHVCFASWMSP